MKDVYSYRDGDGNRVYVVRGISDNKLQMAIRHTTTNSVDSHSWGPRFPPGRITNISTSVSGWGSTKPAKMMMAMNAIADLGIGWVNGIGTYGITAADDMPNHGEATYDGNWVAAIQSADEEGRRRLRRFIAALRRCALFSRRIKSVSL